MQKQANTACLQAGTLDGKTVWITGGGSGLGKAMALRFAALGARLGLSGRREEPLKNTCDEIAAAGGTAAFATCDVRRSDEGSTTRIGWIHSGL